jgi:FkbM family methyltransferase
MKTPARFAIDAIRAAARAGGVELHRVSQYTSPMIRLAMLLRLLRTEVVFDIGANAGQFAQDLRGSGYGGRLVSVEPLIEAHASLVQAAAHDSRWTVAPRAAVGARAGRAMLNVAGNSVSSSLHEMTSAHLEAASESRYVSSEAVDMTTLDALLQQYAEAPDSAVFVKLDVQGHEGDVLAGAGPRLDRIGGLQLEVSLVELYQGQVLMQEQVAALVSRGLTLWSLDRGFMDGRTGQLLQCDATFVRRELVHRS